MNTEKSFTWKNCTNEKCRKHLCKVLHPFGVIEMLYFLNAGKTAKILVSGICKIECPHCGHKNTISHISGNNIKLI